MIPCQPLNPTYVDLLVAPKQNSAIYIGSNVYNQPNTIKITPYSLQLFDISVNSTSYSSLGINCGSLNAFDISASSLTIGGNGGTSGQVLVSTGTGLPKWYNHVQTLCITPISRVGSITYTGFTNIPIIVATAITNDDNVINVSISSVTSIGCKWTTTSIANGINFVIYNTDH